MIWDNPDVKFDKKIVWRKDLDPQTPDGFNGGLLVIHYSPYKNLHEYPALGIQKNHVLKSASRELIADPNYPQYKIFVDDGNSRDFFGVYTTNPDPHIINLLPDNNTLSSYSLPTGITLQNISTPTGTKNINFKVQYNLGEPPNYSFVHYKSPLPSITNFSGNVFLQGILIQNTQLNIAPGTIIDEPDRNMTVTSNANIDANGTSQNPITFRGCGYGQYRLDFRKLIIGNRPSNSPTNQPTRLNYCIFNNLTTITPFQVVTSLPTNIPLLIENNSSDRSDAKMDIMNTSQNLYIQNIGNNNMDIDLGTNGPNGKFTFKGIIHVPQYRTVTFHSSFEGSQYLFENNTYLEIEGNMIAQGSSATQRVFFNNTGNQGDWYFMNVWGSAKLKNCDIKNSWGGLMATSPSGEIKIENCLFENNRQSDISISNFLSARYTPLISNNVFNCSENQAASITCMNGANVDIKNNTFNNVSGSGIFLYYMSNPQVIENVLYASSNPYTEPIAGIFSYSSAGNINCNYSTNFYNGVLLDNSSPKLFNNVITNNGVGLYVTNGSTPQMTPSFDLDITLYDGGYNSIHDNLYEEIKCNNSTGLDVPLSLPVMDNGYNSIYHNGPVDCLFELGNQLLEPYNIRNNYWGVLGPEGRICPSIVNVNYEPFLLEIPPSINCYAQEEIADNSTMLPEVLLMGSANISSHNGEYIEAISKYKQFINLSNNSQFLYLPISSIYHNSVLDSIVDFYSNEIYYQSLSQQYSNETLLSRYCNSFSTASDVMQPSYTEAIDEYQDIIVNPISENERHYANINQIRTFSLMMDSL
ncbi:MAG: right-handed parallel beta-helix repeat-containing protein, partial [Ignavibacteria bacterium]|nr:right-handed parallel beta-helix repeat-containing protein [Ignavibacteria bacterium]